MTTIKASPSQLMIAVEENLEGHVSFLQAQLAGMEVDDSSELLIVDSGLDSDTFNKVLRARLDAANADAHIDRALTYFGKTGRPFTWWVGPCSRPLDLESRLEAHGLRASEDELGMVIDLDTMPAELDPPAGATIRRAATPADIRHFADVLAGLSEPPDEAVRAFFERAQTVLLEEDCPMRVYVAYVDGTPAAASELFISGGLAGIHMVATGERFRRRGLGMALTWRALADGRSLGMTTGALQASEQGVSVYERLGFRECGHFVEYALPEISLADS